MNSVNVCAGECPAITGFLQLLVVDSGVIWVFPATVLSQFWFVILFSYDFGLLSLPQMSAALDTQISLCCLLLKFLKEVDMFGSVSHYPV